jgi:hypothetical protein
MGVGSASPEGRMRKVRAKLNYSNVVSTLCLFLILGGGAYAATHLPKNSVGPRQIRRNAVSGSKVKNRSLTGADLRGSVADAVHAAQADRATTSGDAEKLDGRDAGTFAHTGSEQLHAAAFGPGSANCHWVDYGNGHQGGAYFRDDFGVVHLEGLVKAQGSCFGSPSDAIVMTLPPGYRPAMDLLVPVTAADQLQHVTIKSASGDMVVFNPQAAYEGLFLSLEGLSFRCGPSGRTAVPKTRRGARYFVGDAAGEPRRVRPPWIREVQPGRT